MAPPLADPSPLGLLAFAFCGLVGSCYTAGIFDFQRPPTDPINFIVGPATFHGGLVQIIVGILQMFRGDCMSATIFTSYGAYWLSQASLLIPWFGVDAAYQNVSPQTFSNAVGIFRLGWTIFTLLMLLVNLRTPLSNVVLFASALVTFLLLTADAFWGGVVLHRAAGFSGILNGIVAIYCAWGILLGNMVEPASKTKASQQHTSYEHADVEETLIESVGSRENSAQEEEKKFKGLS